MPQFAPKPVGDSGEGFETDQDTVFVTASVLANDTDANPEDILGVVSFDTLGTTGLVTGNGDGTFTYDPNGAFDYLSDGETATDTFTYTLGDGNALPDPSTFDAVFELADLDGTNGFVLTGVNAGHYSGLAVSGIGDINADGIDDFLVGAPHASPNGAGSGQAYVAFGNRDGFGASVELSSLHWETGFSINGLNSGDALGTAVSGAGDVNGDGVDDFLVSAAFADVEDKADAGTTYVVFGSAGSFGARLDLASLDGTNGFAINGVETYDLSGVRISDAGDVNGDGLADVLIANQTGDDHEAYVVFGSDAGFAAAFELANIDGANGFAVHSTTGPQFSSVSGAGDFNGDGFDDLIVGSGSAEVVGQVRTGEAHILFGSDEGYAASLDLSAVDGSNGFLVRGMEAENNLGRAVSGIGDVNGDGFADIAIAAPYRSTNSTFSGEVYVVFGTNEPIGAEFDLASLDGTNGFAFEGTEMHASVGLDVARAGDVNGDGIDDLLVSAHGGSDSNGAGETYVLFGSRDGYAPILGTDDLDGTNGFVIKGIDENDRSGVSVSAAGDVNGDGVDDLLVGANQADPNGSDSGETYVIYGRQTATATVTIEITGKSEQGGILRGGTDADTLVGDDGDDTLVGKQNDDDLRGGGGHDLLFGGGQNDLLSGGYGSDELYGDFGKDTLGGGEGNDTLEGGQGGDYLTGGAGADTFVLLADATGGVDKITDFSAAEGDRADVSTLLDGYGGLDPFADGYFQLVARGSGLRLEHDTDGGGDSWIRIAVDLTGTITQDDFFWS